MSKCIAVSKRGSIDISSRPTLYINVSMASKVVSCVLILTSAIYQCKGIGCNGHLSIRTLDPYTAIPNGWKTVHRSINTFASLASKIKSHGDCCWKIYSLPHFKGSTTFGFDGPGDLSLTGSQVSFVKSIKKIRCSQTVKRSPKEAINNYLFRTT